NHGAADATPCPARFCSGYAGRDGFADRLRPTAGVSGRPGPPPARIGTVESVREVVEQKDPSGAGLIVGGLVGGGLGSLVGSGTGRTVATVVGALGGAYAGNRIEKSQSQVVYQIGVKYDDGSWATIRQAAPTGLRIGDRVRVTDSGVELLR
ncbi:MAG: glycine zipper 2TM domain-containing protein, partial [Betaproteobacteria bacterium]